VARPPVRAEEGGGLRLFGFGSSSSRKRRPRKQDKARGGAPGGTDDECKATCDDTYKNYERIGHWAKECRQAKRGG
jgi:hypothetical protein